MARVWKRKGEGKSANWKYSYRDYRLENGVWVGFDRHGTGTRGRNETLAHAQRLEEDARRRRHGFAPLHAEAPEAKSVMTVPHALGLWEVELYRLDDTPTYVRSKLALVRRIAASTQRRAHLVTDLGPEHLAAELARLKKLGRSTRTVDHARSRARSFTKFLVQQIHALDRDPWSGFRASRPGSDPRLERRALTDAEAERLIASALAGEPWHAKPPASKTANGKTMGPRRVIPPLTGADRAMIYRLGLEAGLRLGDVAQLCPEHVDAEACTLLIDGPGTKARKTVTHPIPTTLARDLAAFAQDRPIGRPLWRVPSSLAPAVRIDCARATPPIRTHHPADPSPDSDEARAGARIRDVVDYHALRHTYITRLVRNPFSTPKVVQILARHASITTTMSYYAHVPQADLVAALEAIPSPRAANGAATEWHAVARGGTP